MVVEAHQVIDVATLEEVMEVAVQLTHGQVEGIDGPSLGAGLSQPPMAEAVQPPMTLAS